MRDTRKQRARQTHVKDVNNTTSRWGGYGGAYQPRRQRRAPARTAGDDGARQAMHGHGESRMRRIGHGEWHSGEGIAGATVRGSGDTAGHALAQVDRDAAGKPRWLATPASHGPPRRVSHCRGRATPREGEGEEMGMERGMIGDHHGHTETNGMGSTRPPADDGFGREEDDVGEVAATRVVGKKGRQRWASGQQRRATAGTRTGWRGRAGQAGHERGCGRGIRACVHAHMQRCGGGARWLGARSGLGQRGRAGLPRGWAAKVGRGGVRRAGWAAGRPEAREGRAGLVGRPSVGPGWRGEEGLVQLDVLGFFLSSSISFYFLYLKLGLVFLIQIQPRSTILDRCTPKQNIIQK
jgi:hypothetical protein